MTWQLAKGVSDCKPKTFFNEGCRARAVATPACHARPVIIDNPGTTPLNGHKRGRYQSNGRADTFRVAKNNRSKLFDTVSLIESNSLAGYFRLNWSNLCTRVQDLDSARVKPARVSRLAS